MIDRKESLNMNTRTDLDPDLINRIELNTDETETANGGTHDHYCPTASDGSAAKAMAALVSGAVSGSGIANGAPVPGGAMAATVRGAMGAFASVVRFFFGD